MRGALGRERRIQVGLDYFHSIQPVLHVIAFHQKAGLIELAHRPRDILRRAHDIVQRASLMTDAHARVGVARIVEHLVFEADYVLLAVIGPFSRPVLHREIDHTLETVAGVVRQEYAILYAILDSAVGAGSHLPLPHQFEIAEDIFGEQVFGDVRAVVGLEAAILDAPGVAGWNFLARIVPASHGRAVEQGDPSGLRVASRDSESGAQVQGEFHAGDPFCLAKILARILTAVSTSRSLTMKGGRKRSTVSCVQLISRPSAMASSTICLPGISISRPIMRPNPRTSLTKECLRASSFSIRWR